MYQSSPALATSALHRCVLALATPPLGSQVEKCFIATRSSHMVELSASGEDGAIVQPTFAPNAGDKQMSTRSTAGSGRNKQSPEVRVRRHAWL